MSSTVLSANSVLSGAASADRTPAPGGSASHLAADVTYERIAGAIAAVTVHGAQVRVHWKNPLTGTPAHLRSIIAPIGPWLAPYRPGRSARAHHHNGGSTTAFTSAALS